MCAFAEIIATTCPNPPGVIKTLRVVPISTLEDSYIPTINLVTGETDDDINANAASIVWEVTEEDTRFGFTRLGEYDSVHFKHTASLRVKGYEAQVIARLTQASSVPCLMLVTDNGSGETKLYGSLEHPMKMLTLEGTTGATGSTDRVGSTLTFEAMGLKYGPVKYTGVMP